MTKLITGIKRMLNALASADAGEYLTSSQKARYLNQDTGTAPRTAAEQVRPVRPRQQLALYMDSELPADVMHYAVQTSIRFKHSLTVLTSQSDSAARALLRPHADALTGEDIDLQIEVLSGNPVSGLVRYLRRHPEVALLVCNETGCLGHGLLDGSQRRGTLPVPVVLVLNR